MHEFGPKKSRHFSTSCLFPNATLSSFMVSSQHHSLFFSLPSPRATHPLNLSHLQTHRQQPLRCPSIPNLSLSQKQQALFYVSESTPTHKHSKSSSHPRNSASIESHLYRLRGSLWYHVWESLRNAICKLEHENCLYV